MRYAGLILALLFIPVSCAAQPQGIQDLRDNWQIEPGVTVYTADGDTAWVIEDTLWRARVGTKWHMSCPTEMPLQECVDTYDAAYDSLTSEIGSDKEFFYADECVTHLDNATIHIPFQIESVGDTIATIAPDGSCAGYGVVQTEGTTMAAAESYSLNGLSQGGYQTNEPIELEIEGKPTEVEWTSCDSLDIPICAEGSYADGTFHQAAEISQTNQ